MRAHGRWALGPVIAAFCALGCASQAPRVRAGRTEPLPPIAPTSLAAEAAARAGDACSTQLRQQLKVGARQNGDCDATSNLATRRVVSSHGVRFGVVDHRDVNLSRVKLSLSEGILCRGWPLPDKRGEVLHTRDAQRAGCILRPYRGPVTVTAVTMDGQRHEVLALESDSDGRVSFEFSEADAALRADTRVGLDGYARLEVGASGWAGSVDLARLRAFLADWHFAWVHNGRGSAALFAKRHGEHPRGEDAEAYAVEALVVRQEEDFNAVNEGRMGPTSFLQRHVWSPFRHAVESLLLGGPEG
jgi:hypothetical protein